MAKKPENEVELLALVDDSLADDLLTDEYSTADVENMLRAMGADPEEIRRQGEALAAELLEQRRLAWQTRARRKQERARPMFDVHVDVSNLGERSILDLLAQAKSDPRLSGPVGQLFHKRKPENASLEELREIYAEVKALAELDLVADDDPDDE